MFFFFFFFQAEDGIRDADVTGVQTCALPIYESVSGIAKDAAELEQHLSVIDSAMEDVKESNHQDRKSVV